MTKLYIVMERSCRNREDKVIIVDNRIRGIFKMRESAESFIKEAKENREILGAIIVGVEKSEILDMTIVEVESDF